MLKPILKFYLYGSLGFTTEIVFTAFHNLFQRFTLNIPLDLKLNGESYIWMFFIYGIGSILFPLGHNLILKYPLIIRLLLMAIGIFAVEFLAGAILHITTGSCPWEYHSPLAIMGYIRVDYLPAWMLFGFILEKANALFDKMLLNF